MEFCYQLSKSPPTYDFAVFLWNAEQMRLEYDKKSLQIRIVRGNRLRVERDLAFTEERKEWRARHMLYEIAWLMPSVTEVSVVERGIQTVGYNMPRIKKNANVLRSSSQAHFLVHEFLKNHPRPVCIPIRDYEYQPVRNNAIGQWKIVVSWLKSKGYTPISVQDTESMLVGKSVDIGAIDYPAASFSPDLRLALYEQCETSLIINQGPGVLALLGDVKCFLFYREHEGIESCCNDYFVKARLTPDDYWGEGKHIVWCDDKADQIIAAIDRHLAIKEAA